MSISLFNKASTLAVAALAFGFIASQPAMAGTAGGWTRSSTVTDSVVNNGNGSWTYSYTVANTSQQNGGFDQQQPILVDWELPWFGDAGITNIVSPTNWNWAIETIGTANPGTGWEGDAAWQDPNDPFYAGAGSPFTTATQVLHWYNTCWANSGVGAANAAAAAVGTSCEGQFDNAIFTGSSLADFGFDATFDSTAAPYQASWAFLPIRTGDPAFPLGGIPNSPSVRGIPEPGILGLLGLGLIALVVGRRRRV